MPWRVSIPDGISHRMLPASEVDGSLTRDNHSKPLAEEDGQTEHATNQEEHAHDMRSLMVAMTLNHRLVDGSRCLSFIESSGSSITVR